MRRSPPQTTCGNGDSVPASAREMSAEASFTPLMRGDAPGQAGTNLSGAWPKRESLAVAAVAAVLIAGGLLVWYLLSARPQTSGERQMLAVLPFENLTGDPGQEYFSDGLTEEMITQLGGLDPQHLGVIARTSIMHYKGSREPLDQIGRELGVQYVLEGSVRRDSDNVRVAAQLVRVRDQTPVWWHRSHEHSSEERMK